MKRQFTKYPSGYVKASYDKPKNEQYSFTSQDAWICKMALDFWREHNQDNPWLTSEANTATLDKLAKKLQAIDDAGGII